MTIIFSPFIQQIGRVEPYISLDEFKFSATAAAIDYTNLVANGGQPAQDRALSELIVRASAKIDAHCYGRMGTLNATVNTQPGRYRLDRQGRFKIHPSFTPVTAVVGFSWGQLPGVLSPLTLTSANVWPEEESIIIVPWGSNNTTTTYTGINTLSNLTQDWGGGEYYTEFTYVNGWPNSFTTTSTNAGDTSIVLKDATGLFPLNFVTIWDGMNDEYVQIASSYVPDTLTVPLVNPLAYKHGVGVNVSAMHPNIKQACIHFVVAMVVERGDGGIVLTENGADTMVSSKSTMAIEHEVAAWDLLDDFMAIAGRF